MIRIIDFQAIEPIRKVNQNRRFTIPHTPVKVVLATLRITIPQMDANNNRVELIATAGIRGVTGTSQILFKIFRDGREIFRAQEGVEADPSSELNYIVTFQAIDRNLGARSHIYQVTAENMTPGTEAAVVGPISFSALAVDPPLGDRDRGRDRDQDRDQDHNRDRDRDRDRGTARDRNRDRDFGGNPGSDFGRDIRNDFDRDFDRDRRTGRDRDRRTDRDRDRDRRTGRDRDRRTDRDRDGDRRTGRDRDRRTDRDRDRDRRTGRDRDRRTGF